MEPDTRSTSLRSEVARQSPRGKPYPARSERLNAISHPDAILSTRNRRSTGPAFRTGPENGTGRPCRYRPYRDAQLSNRKDLSGVWWPAAAGTPRTAGGDPNLHLPDAKSELYSQACQLFLVRHFIYNGRQHPASEARLPDGRKPTAVPGSGCILVKPFEAHAPDLQRVGLVARKCRQVGDVAAGWSVIPPERLAGTLLLSQGVAGHRTIQKHLVQHSGAFPQLPHLSLIERRRYGEVPPRAADP